MQLEEVERLTKQRLMSDSTDNLSDGAVILDDVLRYIRRFVAYPSEHAAIAHALWIAHTHLMEAWDSTPRIAFLSPEPGSGKSRALEVTESLVLRPMHSINATSAALFRKVSHADGLPTILYDEVDTIFGPKAKEHEDIRAFINAGHRRGAVAYRCVVRGKAVELEEFPAFCPVALAGLGNLPDSILTRSVIVKMRPRLPSELVENYRPRHHEPEGHRLRDRLSRWASEIQPTISTDPPMPDGIADRNADVWEALLSVADAAGRDWPQRARVAAVALVADTKGNRGSLGIALLTDLRAVFENKSSLATSDVLASLIALEEAPWGDLKGKPLDSRRLAKLLRPYEVRSKDVRNGTGTVKGYKAEDLFDPWQRYLKQDNGTAPSLSPQGSATSATTATAPSEEPFQLIEEE